MYLNGRLARLYANFQCYTDSVKERYIIGIDEVGRGPLAGPVTLCACAIAERHMRNIFKDEQLFFGIADSKKLSPAKREFFFERAKKLRNGGYFFYAVLHVSAGVIDKRGISLAVRLGIQRCLVKLGISPAQCRIMLDGSLSAPVEYTWQKTIIGGDATVPIISLASVIAKVTRDRKMVRLAERFPSYGFEIHKGYGTKIHQKALRKKGISALHRRTFVH